MTLSIAYITTRLNPRVHWFLDSLTRQNNGNLEGLNVIVVDLHAGDRNLTDPVWRFVNHFCKHTFPMPSVWQGRYRLTKQDWFDASAARNAALCLAPDGYLAYVDDLSVLCDNWLVNVRQSMAFNGVTLGAYMKIRGLEVIGGVPQPYETNQIAGRDSRWGYGSDSGSVPCNGDMLFGCSLVGPVEAFLEVNGFGGSLCAGSGFEDVITGIVLENAGYRFNYNRNMMTLESEDGHHEEKTLRRESFEKHPNDVNDKPHAILNMAKGGLKRFPDHWGEGGLRAIRNTVLGGGTFPPIYTPEHEWFTGRKLCDL